MERWQDLGLSITVGNPITTAPDTQTSNLGRQAAIWSIVATTYTLGASVAAHIVSLQYDFFRDYISDYAVGPYGWIYGSAFWASFMGTVALAVALSQVVPKAALSRLGIFLMLIMGVTYLIDFFFPTDILPPGAHPATMVGTIHLIAAMIGWILFPVSALLLTSRLKGDAYWKTGCRPLVGLALLSILLFIILIAVVISKIPFGGLAEKVFILNRNIWVLTASLTTLKAADLKSSDLSQR